MGYRSNCLLAIDTSAAHCAAAIFLNGEIFSSVREMKKGQAENLFEVVEETFKAANIEKSQIDLILVGIGPGNFTGIRIGLAAAKGLALSLKIKIAGLNSFQASLYGQTTHKIAKINAPQNSYYLGAINGDFEPKLVEGNHTLNEFANRPRGKEFIENMAKFGADINSSLSQPAPLYIKPPDAHTRTQKISMIK